VRLRLIGLLVVAGLAACSQSADAGDRRRVTGSDLLPRPVLKTVPCSEKSFAPAVPAGTAGVECAVLQVPEDRVKGSGRSLDLPVLFLRSLASNPAPDPIVYLSGGPGDRATDTAAQFIASGRGGRHDLVLLDQRGTGRTKPDLNCPEVEQVVWANLDTTDDVRQEGDRLSASYAACRNRLGRSAVLGAYRSTESAHDVIDLRQAMGVKQVNLLAVSYGTAVALEALRLHPDAVRSAVLDSVVPPWQNGDPSESVDRIDDALARFIGGCDSDPGCHATHPDLEQALLDVRARFDASPHRVQFQDSRGEPRVANLTGADVIRGVAQALYDASFIPLLPGFVEQLRNGDTAVLDAVGAGLLGTAADPPEGLAASVTCAERGSKADSGELDRLAKEHRLSAPLLAPSICDRWDVPAVDGSFRTVSRTKVPTLVLAGQFDPATPPAGSRDVSAKLGPGSAFVEFPAQGHGVLGSGDCASSVIQRFFDNPTGSQDTSCAQTLPPPAWAS